MRAVVVAHGRIGSYGGGGARAWLAAVLDRAGLIVAANGGAGAVWGLGRSPHLVVGDLDSLDAALRTTLEARGCEVRASPRAKDQTDTELALLAACERGATSITVVGAFGGPRLDHALANVMLLALPELVGRDVALVDPRHAVRLLCGPAALELAGAPGDIVTLLPLGARAAGIDTEGLLYPLAGGALERGRSRGVSNELTGSSARVAVREGQLLVVVHRISAPTGHRHRSGPEMSPMPRSGRPRGGASRRRR